MSWGKCEQLGTFNPDGTYESCRFGGGRWESSEEDGKATVYFWERDTRYVMIVGADGTGWGAPVWENPDGETRYGQPVEVKLFRSPFSK